MKKKLTRDSFSCLRETVTVLNENQERAIKGGGEYYGDHGIGYYDSNGNYQWTRTQDGSASGYTSSPSGSYNSNSTNGYGTAGNSITQEDYKILVGMGQWKGGYVQGLGLVSGAQSSSSSSYSSSLYGNSLYMGGSWYAYGEYNHPVSEYDFNKLCNEGRWKGGYVSIHGQVSYTSSESNIYGSSSGSSSNSSSSSCGYQVLNGLCTQGAILEALCRLGINHSSSEVNYFLLKYQNLTVSSPGFHYNMSDQQLREVLSNYFKIGTISNTGDIAKALSIGKVVYSELPVGGGESHSVIVTSTNSMNNTITYWDPVEGTSKTVSGNNAQFIANRSYSLERK